MKKALSVILAVLMTVSMLSLAFSASAADAKNPTYSAQDSLIKENCISGLYGPYTNGMYPTSDGDYGSLIEEIEVKDMYSKYKTFGICYAGVSPTPVAINGAIGTADSKYVYVVVHPVNGKKGADMNSFTFAVPGVDGYAGTIPNGFTLFGCDTDIMNGQWLYLDKAVETAPYTTSAEITKLAEVTGLKDKWTKSTDGKFKFYEADFDKTYNFKYIILAFTLDDYSAVTTDADKNVGMYYSEFAVFADKINKTETTTAAQTTEAATTAEVTTGAVTTDKKTTDPTGDTSMVALITVCGVVAFAATTAIVMRKKEN